MTHGNETMHSRKARLHNRYMMQLRLANYYLSVIIILFSAMGPGDESMGESPDTEENGGNYVRSNQTT